MKTCIWLYWGRIYCNIEFTELLSRSESSIYCFSLSCWGERARVNGGGVSSDQVSLVEGRFDITTWGRGQSVTRENSNMINYIFQKKGEKCIKLLLFTRVS